MKLSVAMMVKNEEAHLERCLKSVLPLFPEIIVLDTGSSDSTVEIAQKYTRHVYHQSWQDNFALHRNKSFSYATGDWVLQIDADEELMFDDPRFQKALLNYLSQAPQSVSAIALLLRDWRQERFYAEHDVIRLFRNGTVKYKRRIHNQPVYKGETVILPQGVWLKHYGYDLTEEQKEKKAKRTIGLLELSLKEDPTDYPSYFYLAQAYGSWSKDAQKSLEYAEKYYSHRQDVIDSGEDFNPSIFYMACGMADSIKDDELKLKWLNRGLKYNPNDLDLFWLKLHHGLKTQNAEFIVSGANGFVAAYENYDRNRTVESGKFVFNRKLESYAAALYYLASAHLENGVIQMRKLKKSIAPQCGKKVEDNVDTQFSALLDVLKIKDIEDYNEDKKQTPSASEHHNQNLSAA